MNIFLCIYSHAYPYIYACTYAIECYELIAYEDMYVMPTHEYTYV